MSVTLTDIRIYKGCSFFYHFDTPAGAIIVEQWGSPNHITITAEATGGLCDLGNLLDADTHSEFYEEMSHAVVTFNDRWDEQVQTQIDDAIQATVNALQEK